METYFIIFRADYARHLSKMGNIKDGRTNFEEQTSKYKNQVSNSTHKGGSYDIGVPGILGVSGEHKRANSAGSARQNNEFSNERTIDLIDTIEEERNW